MLVSVIFIPEDLHANIDRDLQHLYETHLAVEKVNKLLLPEHADHLQLQLTDATMQQAIQRRINQLSGSMKPKKFNCGMPTSTTTRTMNYS